MITRTLLFSALLFQAGIASAVLPGPDMTRQAQRTVQPTGDDMLKATPFRYTKKTKSIPVPTGAAGISTEFKRLVIE